LHVPQFHAGAVVPVGKAKYRKGLVLQADGDTQTPYPSGVAMAHTLGSRLITVANEGIHTQFANRPGTENDFPQPNRCVDDKVNAYLIDGALPPGDVTCQSVNLSPSDSVTGGQRSRVEFDRSRANTDALRFLEGLGARRFH
jgi:hypothetical protein